MEKRAFVVCADVQKFLRGKAFAGLFYIGCTKKNTKAGS
jgi:hypothetical protein